ncbi:hypothetical protein [Chitinophaga sp. ARDCPP14]|uniref:hypothetical protein n=1 Tax=Chitinophaga sp. ARDCPP14 TaxID=3391139 RepID=UPI003F52461D
MIILFNFYLFILGVFNNMQEPNIYNLFYHWNKTSLAALDMTTRSANNDQERNLYQSKLDAMSDIWKIKPGSINNESLRWLFLEQISPDFDWKDKDWAVIEVKKSGERISLMNYLIYYHENETKIIVYDYNRGKWIKLKESIEHFRINDLIRSDIKVPINEGRNFCDIVVTDFRSTTPLHSMFFVENTLAQSSVIAAIIAR